MTFLQRLLEDPAGLRKLKRGSCVVLGVILLAELVLPHLFHGEGHGEHHKIEGWPAFGSVLGLIASVVIVFVSKAIGKIGLMRRETFYDS